MAESRRRSKARREGLPRRPPGIRELDHLLEQIEKNLEIVLDVTVVGQSGLRIEVEASEVWGDCVPSVCSAVPGRTACFPRFGMTRIGTGDCAPETLR